MSTTYLTSFYYVNRTTVLWRGPTGWLATVEESAKVTLALSLSGLAAHRPPGHGGRRRRRGRGDRRRRRGSRRRG
jgi:hypothetical protein